MDENELLQAYQVARADYVAAVTLGLIELAKQGIRLTPDEMRIADCVSTDLSKIRHWHAMSLETKQQIARLRHEQDAARKKLRQN